MTRAPIGKSDALRFVVLLGLVSLFADMTYESARSISGPYLGLLGASATIVGFVAGFGELVGYALRLAAGTWADRSKRYWAVTFTGYTLNLFAVPLLALAGNWTAAAILMIVERAGKAIRTPARDAMLSYATRRMGHGWGFGLHEALDQTGATIGPLIVAWVIRDQGSMRPGFAVLLAPAVLAFATLVLARRRYPRPQALAPTGTPPRAGEHTRSYWLLVVAGSLVALGYADYSLIAYHFTKTATVPVAWIAIFYAFAMASAGAASLLFGLWFDRKGIVVLILSILLSIPFAPLTFFGGFDAALAGAIAWGVGMGAHDSIMKSAVASMTPADRRATAFGFFDMTFGIAWFVGSFAMGFLYDRSVTAVVAFSICAQIMAIAVLLACTGIHARDRSGSAV